MSNTYFKAMSVMGCEIGGITRRSLCRHNCCDGENCVTWLEKQFAKLNEYEEAKADGRMVVLPCKPSDTVYRIISYKCNAVCNKLNACNSFIYKACKQAEFYVCPGTFQLNDMGWIGKTVFLTREEAEKALGEQEVQL